MIASSPRPADPDTTGGELREESVDLTPGVVWTDAQLAVVRDLAARAHRAETALQAAHVAAPDTTGGELRAAVTFALIKAEGGTYTQWADAVLASPALRDLLAERDTLAAQVQGLADFAADMINAPDDSAADWGYDLAYRLGLLDVTPTTGGGE